MERKEALEVVRKNMPTDKSLPVYEALQTLIPELAENEDERIRKKLIEIIGYFRSRGIDQQLCEEFLAYLEKQKEQKPEERFKEARKKYQVEWSEEDEKIRQSLILLVSNDKTNGYTEFYKEQEITCDKVIAFLKSLRPSWKPSEEQIYSLGTVVKGYDECTVGSVGYHLKEMYEQLKKLM